MTIYECIFFRSRFHIVLRHVGFWIVIGLFFFLQSVVPGIDVYFTALISLICFLPASILATYMSIYLLFPFFIERGKYLRFILCFAVIILIALGLNSITVSWFLSLAQGFVESREESAAKGLAMVNTSHAVVIAGLGLGIKLTKNWYQQQRENATLARQKIASEVQLAKAKVYPRFLFQSLDKLRANIAANSPDAPASLLTISDVLSYVLYDSRESAVPLKTELDMLQKRIKVENDNRDEVKFYVQIVGDAQRKLIPPLALFAFLEESIKLLENEIKFHQLLHLEITIDINCLKVRLRARNIATNLRSVIIPIRDIGNAHTSLSIEKSYGSY